MQFDHIGVPAESKRDGMRYLESKRLWLTSPADHAYAWPPNRSTSSARCASRSSRVGGAPVEFVQAY